MGTVILVVLRALEYLYALQPRRLQIFWGELLGDLFWRFKFRLSVVESNLTLAFPESPGERKRICRPSYRPFGSLILECLMILGPMKKFTQKYVDLTGTEHLEAARAQGKGIVFLASHLGNWEVMAATAGVIVQT